MKRIELTGKHGEGKFVLVDDEDYEWICQSSWYVHKTPSGKFYPKCRRFGWLHKAILKAPSGIIVDHIDRDTLNNQKSNLRLATKAQNVYNSGPYSNNKTGYKGVSPIYDGKFKAEIWYGDNYKYLGVFSTAEEAAEAYNEAAKEFHGEFAYFNDVA